MVVRVAGRCAERLLLGEGRISSVGAEHLDTANIIAKMMIYKCGFSKYLGPVPLMESSNFDDENTPRNKRPSNISTELARLDPLSIMIVATSSLNEVVTGLVETGAWFLVSNEGKDLHSFNSYASN